MSKMLLLLPFVLAAASARASAHDFWVRPSAFRATAEDRLTIDLRVGERFRGEPVARDPAKFERFVAIGADGKEEPIVGQDGQAPAGILRPRGAGPCWIVYRSTPKSIELRAEEFEAYLAEEGLERVSKLRAERGDAGKPGRERYSRCAKALVRVGAAESRGFDRIAGLPLELVPETDPSDLAPGAKLPVIVLYQGRPLEGVLVGAMAEVAPEKETRLRTDASGRVEFVVDEAGPWLVHAVHMVPAEAGSGADWESSWASLTFEPRATER